MNVCQEIPSIVTTAKCQLFPTEIISDKKYKTKHLISYQGICVSSLSNPVKNVREERLLRDLTDVVPRTLADVFLSLNTNSYHDSPEGFLFLESQNRDYHSTQPEKEKKIKYS